jgi:predicted dinucleotide-binding enzyme
MKIAILGTGSVGRAFATKLISLGHSVIMGTRNVQSSLEKKEKSSLYDFLEQNKDVKLATFSDAAAQCEMIIVVTKGEHTLAALQLAGEKNLAEKIVIDITNPLDFSKGFPPSLYPELSNTNSLGEEIQKRFPAAKVIKTLNTMWNGLMINPGLIAGGNHVNYLCGNDKEAKEKVRKFLNELGWKNESLMDLGDISAARATEATLPIWLRVYGAKQSGAFNFAIVS